MYDCSNSFSAVCDLQTIGFEVCEVSADDFSILILGTLRRRNSDFSARRMHVWRESATVVSYHAKIHESESNNSTRSDGICSYTTHACTCARNPSE